MPQHAPTPSPRPLLPRDGAPPLRTPARQTRVVRLCATALVIGGLGAAWAPSAFAAGTTWRPIEPGAAINDTTAETTAPGYAVGGILGRGETLLGRYRNFQNETTGAYCLIAGLPYSEAADLAESIDGGADPVVAYALSAYGSATDRETTTAVAWIAHARMDHGTDDVSAQDRRAAFTRALEDAPAAIRERVREIVAEAEAYRPPTMDAAALATGVTITGSASDGSLAAVIDVPDGHPSVVTLAGSATFADGTQTATVSADTTLPLTPGDLAQGATAALNVTVDPVDEAVTAHASTIQTYRQAGTDARGRAFQVMAWAVPTTAPLRTAEADISWTAPYTPPQNVTTTAHDAADRDGIVNPGGTVQDTYVASGLAPGASYTLETLVVNVADGTATPATSRTEFTAETADVRVVTSVDLPADLPEGRYAVSQRLLGPHGAQLDLHDGTTAPSQQFTLASPRIGTTATDRADGDTVLAHTGGVLVDTVAYENLRTGQEYEVRGTVMDKATGTPLTAADGREVTASARFTPTEASGTTTVEFTLDATIAGHTLVVFEDLAGPDGTVIAAHRDLADEGQTVTAEKTPPAPTPTPTPTPTPPSTPQTPAPQTPAPEKPAPEKPAAPVQGPQVRTGGEVRTSLTRTGAASGGAIRVAGGAAALVGAVCLAFGFRPRRDVTRPDQER